MNIFEHHLSEIKKIILSEKDSLKLKNIDNLKGVNLEIPLNNSTSIYHVILQWFLEKKIK